jgi:hypothetical protein
MIALRRGTICLTITFSDFALLVGDQFVLKKADPTFGHLHGLKLTGFDQLFVLGFPKPCVLRQIVELDNAVEFGGGHWSRLLVREASSETLESKSAAGRFDLRRATPVWVSPSFKAAPREGRRYC